MFNYINIFWRFFIHLRLMTLRGNHIQKYNIKAINILTMNFKPKAKFEEKP